MDADLRWMLNHRVCCAFSTAVDGDLRDPELRRAWLDRVGAHGRCAVLRQVHGATVVEADAESSPAALADAQITTDLGLSLMAFGADCPGLCLAAPDLIGVAHCGWRGTAAGIVTALVGEMTRRSQYPPQAFAAFIGPGIAAEDYEVDEPVLSARPWPPASIRPGRPGHAWLDLAQAIAADLQAAGVVEVRVAVPRTGQDGRLRSYRRHGAGLVQGLVAWRVEDEKGEKSAINGK